ncbi:hypothetical protein GH741_18065 [Aquibacillus halophilus]|uniref:Uncharacterized protein n=1 Tax=Aquibacillus halophilus TaxID=930132 RepID=A0A6A8DFZ2_9BACI|nr:hypothetical protein [Aquibacillus halophilus]MRH44554.1 hypothetical protein [Aquibacillus halophilus]
MNFDLASISDQMPDFENHDQARVWFKDQFSDRFSLTNSNVIDGKKVYFYHIIKNPEVYHQYMESFAKPVKHDITNMETFESYSTVEISEDGEISLTL